MTIYLDEIKRNNTEAADSCVLFKMIQMKKKTEISNVHGIYWNAFSLIVAVSGNDASAGLPGLEDHTRDLAGTTAVFNAELCIIVGRLNVEEVKHAQTWATRGLTFQEGLLAKRLLIIVSFSLVLLDTSLRNQLGF
jgi:hypothetical protein